MIALVFAMAVALPANLQTSLDHLDVQLTQVQTVAKSIESKDAEVVATRRRVEEHAALLLQSTARFRDGHSLFMLLVIEREVRTLQEHIDWLIRDLDAVHDPATKKVNDLADALLSSVTELDDAAGEFAVGIDARLITCGTAKPQSPNKR